MKYLTADAVSGGIVYAGKCMPSNDTLSSAINDPVAEFAGAFWGATPYIIVLVVIIGVILIIANALNDKPQKWIKGIGIALIVGIAAYFVLAIYFVISGNPPEFAACPF